MTEMWKKHNTLIGKLHNIDEAFTFDDVTLIPQYSDIDSRSEIDISVAVCKSFKFSSPLIPANMSTVSGAEMLMYCYQQKSLGLLHRFMEFEEKKSLLTNLKMAHPDIFNYVGVSIGVKDNDYQELKEYAEMGIRIVCIDVAHLDSKIGLKMVRHVTSNYPKMLLIAGTVATRDGTYRAFEAGADIVRVGISGGSICTTREETGNGVPQISAISEAFVAKQQYMKNYGRQVFLISDGGVTKPSDFCKALCFTDMVIAGNIFAGTNEAPGQVVEVNGISYKHYDGSSTLKNDRIEGVKALVARKGPAKEVFTRMHQGLQSCCSYQNCRSVDQLQEKAVFARVSNAGAKEGNYHNVILREKT